MLAEELSNGLLPSVDAVLPDIKLSWPDDEVGGHSIRLPSAHVCVQLQFALAACLLEHQFERPLGHCLSTML